MNKRDLTEQEIRSRYIRPALIDAGWQPAEKTRVQLLDAIFTQAVS